MSTKPKLKPCAVSGCLKSQKQNDQYCSMHRARITRTNRIDLRSPLERLMNRIVKSPSGCWEYLAYKDKYGYGRLRINGKKILVHRYIYELMKGIIPYGKMICHSCDNPKCVNPDHLWIGDAKANHLDAVNKGRINPSQRSKRRWAICPTLRKLG